MVTKRVIVPARAASSDGSPASGPEAFDDAPAPAAAIEAMPGAQAEAPAPALGAETFEPAAPAVADEEAAAAVSSAASPFWPLLLVTLAWLVWMAFQLGVSLNDRKALRDAHAQQQQTVDKSAQLRATLDALAGDTQRLAESGNANARALVDELRRRGVTIKAATAAPASK